MKNKDLSRWLSPLSLLAFVLGLVLGLWQPQLFPPIAFLGNIYVNMLKLIVIPLLMTEVACGVYESSRGAGNRLVKTVGLFVVMFVVSFLVTAVLVTLISRVPGSTSLRASGTAPWRRSRWELSWKVFSPLTSLPP